MKALGTGSYPLTVDVRVELLEVELGVRVKLSLPLAAGDSDGGTITGSCGGGGTITSSRGGGTITDGSSGGGTIITISDLDRISSIAKQLFPIDIEAILVISMHAGHTKVIIDGVTQVLVVTGHCRSSSPSMAHGGQRPAANRAKTKESERQSKDQRR